MANLETLKLIAEKATTAYKAANARLVDALVYEVTNKISEATGIVTKVTYSYNNIYLRVGDAQVTLYMSHVYKQDTPFEKSQFSIGYSSLPKLTVEALDDYTLMLKALREVLTNQEIYHKLMYDYELKIIREHDLMHEAVQPYNEAVRLKKSVEKQAKRDAFIASVSDGDIYLSRGHDGDQLYFYYVRKITAKRVQVVPFERINQMAGLSVFYKAEHQDKEQFISYFKDYEKLAAAEVISIMLERDLQQYNKYMSKQEFEDYTAYKEKAHIYFGYGNTDLSGYEEIIEKAYAELK